MGRGRAKAKQQKVARELKYNSHFTDLDALQRELRGGPSPGESSDGDEELDEQADAVDGVGNDVDGENGTWARSGS